jgi:hypothetical protein
MQLLKKVIHPHIESFDGKIFKRVSARGVIEKDGKILLMYTKRYNDYTFPGGGGRKRIWDGYVFYRS